MRKPTQVRQYVALSGMVPGFRHWKQRVQPVPIDKLCTFQMLNHGVRYIITSDNGRTFTISKIFNRARLCRRGLTDNQRTFLFISQVVWQQKELDLASYSISFFAKKLYRQTVYGQYIFISRLLRPFYRDCFGPGFCTTILWSGLDLPFNSNSFKKYIGSL